MKVVQPCQKYRLCGIMAMIRKLSSAESGCLESGGYLSRINEFVAIFDAVYRDFSEYQLNLAFEKIAELIQKEALDGLATDFFISDAIFIRLDYTSLEEFIYSKFSCILMFIEFALHQRMRELGVYFDLAERNESSKLSGDRRDQLNSDTEIISWFLNGDLNSRLESYYGDIPDSGLGLLGQDDPEEAVVADGPLLAYDDRPKQ
jgi:hypothetical protein